MRPRVEISDDPAGAAAELLSRAAGAGAQIALAGGSTPRAAYERAAELGADWSAATAWFGDERCVPPDHEHSNFRMAKLALLDRLAQPPRVERMEGERGAQEGATRYEARLQEMLGDQPRLDLILLGLGPDAHTASLFPRDEALAERGRLAIGVEVPGMAPLVPRITLTLPVIDSAASVVFLVSGEDKAEAVARAFGGRSSPDAPASLVSPSDGELVLLCDPAAASHLDAAR